MGILVAVCCNDVKVLALSLQTSSQTFISVQKLLNTSLSLPCLESFLTFVCVYRPGSGCCCPTCLWTPSSRCLLQSSWRGGSSSPHSTSGMQHMLVLLAHTGELWQRPWVHIMGKNMVHISVFISHICAWSFSF